MKRLASLLAILLTFMTVNPSLANASAPDRELLHNGHADVAHVEWDQASGRPTIKILWNESELKEAKDVYIRLGPDADATGRETSRLRVLDDPRFGFLGKPGDIVWTAPQKESDKWAPVAAAFGAGHSFPDELMDRIKPETLHLDLVDVDGPGEFNAFTVNPLGVSHLFSSTGTDHRRQVVHPGSHTHTSWAFSQPGRYNLTWQAAVETRDGKTIESDPTVVSWLVGTDEQVGLDKGSTQPAHEITTPAEQFPIAKGQDTGSDDPLAFNPTANMAGCLHHASGPVTLKADWQASWKSDDPQKPARPKMSVTSGDSGKQIDGEVGVINVPDSLKAAAPQAGADEFNGIFAAGTQFHRIPASAQNGQPNQVLDTTGTDFVNLHEADITWDPIEGPQGGQVSVVDTTDGQTRTVLSSSESSLRTVMRVNKAEKTPMEMWFSKPGFYRISGYYTIHGKPDANGRKQHRYVPFTMQYAVGDAAVANACQGKPANPKPSPEPGKPAYPAPKPDPVPDNSHTDGNNVVLDRGHLDAFRVGSSADGGIDLKLKEDVTGEGVLREPENVLLKVRDSALTDIPSGLPGAPKGYVLPLTQKSGLLWPGWETFDVKRNGFTTVKINVSDVKGPGTVNLFSQGTLGDVRSLLDGNSTTLPGTITVKQPTHEHANWVFSKPGVYTMTVQASAEKDGKAFQSKPHTYTWVVGDKTELPAPWGTGAPADAAKPSPAPSDDAKPDPVPTARPGQDSAPEPSTEPTAKQDSDKKPGTDGKSNGDAKPGADKKNPCSQKLVLDHGHSDVFRVGSADRNGLNLKVKEDVTGEGVLHTPEDVLLAVKDSALMSIPKGYPGTPKGYVLPITQNPDLLWPGWETFDVKRNGFSEVKINVRDVKGPGKVHLFTQNSFA
ncbi:TIGR03773 family transporter-associated surface protein, partial [Cutibacterium granulosum]|uniref:TIGR03773 family transporter-associated surface protein n=1 Tax=Cutibacterium granulosum TaxID=33011 RepID=UPI002B23127E